MIRLLVLLSILVGAWDVSAKAPDPATVDFEASEVTCDEAQAFVQEQGSARIGYRGIFDWYQVTEVTLDDPCHYTQMPDYVYLTTKEGVSCYMGYGRFCRPDSRYQP